MKISIIVIGDEILLGQVVDTNSGEIARTLGPDGWEVRRTLVVGDNGDDIRRAIELSMGDSDLVITTGGLGPTKDDITKTILTGYFGGELREDPAVLENIKTVFDKRGLTLNDLTRQQALVPTSCRVIQNTLGTAPIMWFERDGKVLIAMPGVPFEMVGMLHREVADMIRRRFAADMVFPHRTFMVTGITESALAERLTDFENSLPENMHLAYLPTPGLIRLRLDGRFAVGDDTAAFDSPGELLKELLGSLMVYDGDATAAEIVIALLRERGMTVSTAESCTGGAIASSITAIAGCSDVYYGSVVSYSNAVKSGVLGVNADDIKTYGAVSESVVRQMAEGVARVTGTDCSVATSGVAGPSGGSPEKPVGTVWIAAHTPAGTVARCFRFPGDRARVIDRAARQALLMLAECLRTK